MTEAELKVLKDKLVKADELQTKITTTQERIKKINFEISTQQDGSGELNIRLHTFPVVPYEKVYGTDEVTNKESINLGEIMIDALQKRIDKWKAELEKI